MGMIFYFIKRSQVCLKPNKKLYNNVLFYSKGYELSALLLSILEIGGYPDFSKNYAALGFDFKQVASMRKGIQFIKKNKVDFIIAEFNYQSDFRDRTSQLETLMATIQPKPEIKVIVFYDKEQAHQLKRLTSRFVHLECLAYPIQAAQVEEAINKLKSS